MEIRSTHANFHYRPTAQVLTFISRILLVNRFQAISELPFASVSKRVLLRSHSHENVCGLEVHFYASQDSF